MMVEHQLLTNGTEVRPLTSQRTWSGLFHDLKNGETAYITGTLEELRLIRRRISSAYHFRKRTDPLFKMEVRTKIGMVEEQTALIISGVNSQ